MAAACPACGCMDADGLATHSVRAALVEGDLDRALTLGLLDVAACDACDHVCTEALLLARQARARALAARERFRVRQLRLTRCEQQQRAPRADAAATSAATAPLPAAAAAALARAKAKAAARR